MRPSGSNQTRNEDVRYGRNYAILMARNFEIRVEIRRNLSPATLTQLVALGAS